MLRIASKALRKLQMQGCALLVSEAATRCCPIMAMHACPWGCKGCGARRCTPCWVWRASHAGVGSACFPGQVLATEWRVGAMLAEVAYKVQLLGPPPSRPAPFPTLRHLGTCDYRYASGTVPVIRSGMLNAIQPLP